MKDDLFVLREPGFWVAIFVALTPILASAGAIWFVQW